MKKWLLALSTLAVLAHPAFAQNNLTLFGVIDSGVDYADDAQAPATPTNPGNQGRISRPQLNMSGTMHGSRLGLRGTQELGQQGWQAVFLIENGFEVNDGRRLQNNRLFGRQAFAGLRGDDFGTVTIGRHYDSIVDFTGPLAASNKWAGGIATHPGDIDNFNNSRRVNHAIKFTSITYNGLNFGGLYSLGGVPGHVAKNQIWSVGASYKNGPLHLGTAYLNINNPNLSFYETSASGGGNNMGKATAFGVDINPSYAGYASARTLQIIGAGGSYTFGQMIAGLLYSNIQFKGLNETASGPLAATNPSGYRGGAKFNNLEASLAYRFSSQLTGMLVYDYLKSNRLSGRSPITQVAFQTGATYHQINLGLNYLFKKGTDIYWLAAYQRANGIDSTGQHAVASISGVRPSTTHQQKLMRLGFRHRF